MVEQEGSIGWQEEVRVRVQGVRVCRRVAGRVRVKGKRVRTVRDQGLEVRENRSRSGSGLPVGVKVTSIWGPLGILGDGGGNMGYFAAGGRDVGT